jgi:predicted phosphodiesterase
MKNAKFVAVSCIHVPHHRDEVLDWLVSRLEEIKPTHFILLGDLFEAGSVSVHPSEYWDTLECEYEAGAAYLETIRSALPKSCELVWTLGNHDDNIQCPDPRRSNWLTRSLIHWNKNQQYGGIFKRWKQIPYVKGPSGVYRLGPCRFYHGFDAGVNSDETLQMVMALKDQAWGLYVRGHTHRPTPGVLQCRRTQKVLLPWWYANPGTLGPLKPGYMARKDSSLWGAGLVSGECTLASPRRPSFKDWDASMEHFE